MVKKVVVTGGAGFTGSHLVEALAKKGYQPIIFDSVEPRFTPEVPFIKGSVTDREATFAALKGADAVFHLAGMLGTHETVTEAYNASMINIIGMLNVLDAAKEHGLAVLDITKPNYWRNTYTITKIAAEEFCMMYRDEFGMNVKAARWFNVFGPRQRTEDQGYQKAVPTFIMRTLKGQPIHIYGDGTQGTDHIYVGDAIDATIAIFESPHMPQHPVEVGSGKEITVNEIADVVFRLIGKSVPLEHIPMRRGETEHTRIQADLTALKNDIGYEPKTSFEDGIKKTIEYYRTLVPPSVATAASYTAQSV
ncbi:hypothetical protein A2852_01315 [Candidatus Adlerbacteria bacterium RIFCSPHIGHO2_01_FULL_54_23]|uniref:NAD-dependent epimerase/dehydratase domain-containing protein n=3 Tax=Candidatus Adleribacteriota TaxID=1752736 RepID=A0A1F4Y0A7_9BACT|nr:MAG: Nucleoside-diphosphate-sugar epimerase [Candidatus Adlerbacteria bacterium GW2011_GWA1_54_10]KKW36380.1 MAG: Nucleoside-diphosphate-sugar epimerase [Candidatus Adlerbacteria bacterium GW2011_GWA2_54_12]KKW37468.1 MAG: Nucleoside-diphosphate-sugar epimerase [Candidatus Adlerbacteria bacterium GW2011_GWB1_54_7]OGC79249.1 MAG: hypothetical protein A2852_01315 [Candidatus Adlerbacteria bacterium RIFCSPHIGHO2_01_FULL_54_23]OGC87359.1 MAG: hypothetical protein A3B33_00205 [Candidatus Adlerbac